MFETLKRLYFEGKIQKEYIEVAVQKRWITEEQAKSILNAKEVTND